MANKMYYGPDWPLPRVNYGQSLAANITPETSEYYQAAAMDIIISAPSTNLGDIYLVRKALDGTYSRLNDGTVIYVVSPGLRQSIPSAQYGESRYNIGDYGIDADDDYDSYFACAIMV